MTKIQILTILRVFMSSLSTFPGSGCVKGKNLWEWGIFRNGFYVFFLTQRRRSTKRI